jgi:hypothetical protein
MSGYTCTQRIFFTGNRGISESAGGHSLNTLGAMWENDKAVPNLFAINQPVKTI